MTQHQEEAIVSNALELISATSTWMLVRHQWLINTMRCVLTGENTQPVDQQYEFDRLLPNDLGLPKHLIDRFTEIRFSIENIWKETTKTSHPLTGLSIFEQLDNYQNQAEKFMLASKETNQQLIHEFAMRDPLTGARTRLTLASCLHREMNHAKRYLASCTIALLDQDDFKSINDRWGHVVGDQVITKTAEIITSTLRPTDKLFRYGGDEWLILMPATTTIEAELAIKSMQTAYAENAFTSRDGSTFFLSFSYGLAESNHHKTIEDWVSDADSRLYANKRKNRD